ncbi:hypothetical protein B2J93_7912 [Marssonina coronariae]|uniref:Uncharacterized protein n=1 Tax=Diplocarpon coronariae TaxID=2795749 RepID=A0A218ZC39_9HELO|nr:hypothetical protein B2J93_7912 [Marssonina coronariae]
MPQSHVRVEVALARRRRDAPGPVTGGGVVEICPETAERGVAGAISIGRLPLARFQRRDRLHRLGGHPHRPALPADWPPSQQVRRAAVAGRTGGLVIPVPHHPSPPSGPRSAPIGTGDLYRRDVWEVRPGCRGSVEKVPSLEARFMCVRTLSRTGAPPIHRTMPDCAARTDNVPATRAIPPVPGGPRNEESPWPAERAEAAREAEARIQREMPELGERTKGSPRSSPGDDVPSPPPGERIAAPLMGSPDLRLLVNSSWDASQTAALDFHVPCHMQSKQHNPLNGTSRVKRRRSHVPILSGSARMSNTEATDTTRPSDALRDGDLPSRNYEAVPSRAGANGEEPSHPSADPGRMVRDASCSPTNTGRHRYWCQTTRHRSKLSALLACPACLPCLLICSTAVGVTGSRVNSLLDSSPPPCPRLPTPPGSKKPTRTGGGETRAETKARFQIRADGTPWHSSTGDGANGAYCMPRISRILSFILFGHPSDPL